MGPFDAIRPYNDQEVPAVLARLCSDPELLAMLTRYRFPQLTSLFGWMLKPLIGYRLRRELKPIDSVAALQEKIEPYVERAIRRATDGISYSGLERLQAGKSYLFMANHRDIVMDPAFVNYAVYHAGDRKSVV